MAAIRRISGLDDEDAVADQRGAEDGQDGEDEDRDEDDLFLLQAGKEAERGIEDADAAEVLRAVDRVVDDGARNLDELAVGRISEWSTG
jgi:hypothetical protein